MKSGIAFLSFNIIFDAPKLSSHNSAIEFYYYLIILLLNFHRNIPYIFFCTKSGVTLLIIWSLRGHRSDGYPCIKTFQY